MKRVNILKSLIAMSMVLALLLTACGQAQPGGSEAPPADAGTTGTGTGDNAGTSASGASTPDERLMQRYDEPVRITTVLGYREPEDSRAPSDLTPETSTAVKKVKELFNIELEYLWIVNNDQYDAKFGAELAAGNLPDVMYIPPNMFEDLYQQGAFADLTETYELYANENLKNLANFDGQIINAGKRDGKLYGLPMATHPAQVTSQIWYRMDVLRDYGITSANDLPKTVAEFEELADKIVAGNGGRPIMPAAITEANIGSGFIDVGLADFSPLFHAYEAWPNAKGWVEQSDGTLDYSGIHPNVKDAVTKLNEWYEKGYFPKDFAAMDAYAADSPVVSGIVAGDYPIVFGSWWIPGWPLNMNKALQTEADWVLGPTLSKDGAQPMIQLPRYPVNNFVAISRDCKNPEAVLKMINWEMEYMKEVNALGWQDSATEEEKLEYYSHVYFWMPWRTYVPTVLIDNQVWLSEQESRGADTLDKIDLSTSPNNGDTTRSLDVYLQWHRQEFDDDNDFGQKWGYYTSRISAAGGIARINDLFKNSRIQYAEVFIATPSMVTKQAQLDTHRINTIVHMIMGDVPISDWDKFVEEWNNLGGNDIRREVNEWYQNEA